ETILGFEPRLVDLSSATRVASLAPLERTSEPARVLAEPFGATLSDVVKGGLQAKWARVIKALRHERKVLARCRADADSCPPAAKRFLAIVNKGQARDGITRIAEINRAVNLDIRPLDDMAQHGVADLWATPLETF